MATTNNNIQVPTIDLSNPNENEIISQVARACSTIGFFHVIHHDIPHKLTQAYQSQTKSFFDLPYPIKQSLRRNETNARGYFDDELTKQKLDWKECLDVGVPGSRDWNDSSEEEEKKGTTNTCLDGCNRFPEENVLPGFRSTVVEYFEACVDLSD